MSRIGADAACKLQKHFGGDYIAFPTKKVHAFIRDRKLAIAWRQGRDLRELARENRISERTAMRALDRIKTGDLPRPPQ